MSSQGAPVKKVPPPRNPMDTFKNFAVGGLSGMTATACIQPIDMVKVRIQLKSEARSGNLSPITVAKEIYKNEGGIKGFYAGIDSALLRQAVYASLRIGLYFNLCDFVRDHYNNGENVGPMQKVYLSLFAGAVGSFIGTPFDVALVRMQSDMLLPVEKRRNYSNVFNAFFRIWKEEGPRSFFNGASGTIGRAMSLNLSQLVTYEECKHIANQLVGKDKTKTVMFISSMIAAVATSCASLPFDNIKTKLQKQQKGPDGTYPYKGFFDCGVKTVRNEGIRGFWAGLPTYYMRVGPHSVILLLTADNLKRIFNLNQ